MGVSLLGVGVLLLGVAAVVAVGIVLHAYLTMQMSYRPPPPPPFTAYCRNSVVVISAYEDLTNVQVLDVNGTAVCTFDKIGRGSDEICRAGGPGIYLIVVGGFKRAVDCVPLPPPRPID